MSAKSPAISLAGGIVYERLRREVITVEACDAAVELVYALWLERGMFGCQCERETVSEFTAPMVRILRDSATAIDRRTEAGL